MFRKALAATAAVGLFMASGPALAATPQSTFSLQISGFVPTICNAQLPASAVPSQGGTVSLGQMSEFCNDANGYQVWVDYSPDMAGDTIQVGSQTVTLTSSGSALIDSSALPDVVTKDVSLTSTQGAPSGSLSIRVIAL